MWAERLRDEPRFHAAVEELWPYALGVLPPELRPELARRTGLSVDSTQAVERGSHTDELEPLWHEMTEVRRSVPGRVMVTADQVWAALDEIPDPEIPVISLVDLGVIRDVTVDGDTRARRVHADVPRLPRARGDAARARGEGRRRSARRRRSR